MNKSVVTQIAEWSQGQLTDEQLLQGLENSKPDLEAHRNGFGQVVSEFTEQQQEHCQDVVDFCFLMFDQISEALENCAQAIKDQNKSGVFFNGDVIARNSHQLNLAQVELRNRALLALGPTEIPNLNLLLMRRDDFLAEPGDDTALLFSEAIDSERIVVKQALDALAQEPDITEVSTLINAFRDHMNSLNLLADTLALDGEEGDYESLFLQLGVSFPELQKLVPLVQMKLRGTGETEFPDINNLIKLIEDVAQGNIGDAMLLEATEAAEEAFGKTKEQLGEVQGKLPSTLANDELAAALESFEEFEDGVEAIYKFLEDRERVWLEEAKGCLLEFGKLFGAHQNKLKELEEQQGQLLCPMCSTPNDSSRNRCAKCGGPLPQNVASATVSTFESREQAGLEGKEKNPLITANIEKLYIAVNEVAAGEIDHHTFLQAVDQFEGSIEAGVQSLPQEPESRDENQKVMVDKLYEAFERGVETLRSAMDLMRSYPENENQEVLSKAVQMVDEGAKLVAAAGEVAKR